FPQTTYLNPQHYNPIFTTHATLIILFIAIPFLIPLINLLLPLQIPAPDVPYPFLNPLTFSLFFLPPILFNIPFLIPPSPHPPSTSYFPIPRTHFTSGVGNNYYAIPLHVSPLA
ncbi:cbb3-type cytochrome c oxidase subunit I, partial [Bacillus thuringiensis]|uniref:cbb3-type cytochrome c oxidase subunit I n=1 Tax=Bacillus thuringiensis TaxID=1428 RepID=UPI001642AD3F